MINKTSYKALLFDVDKTLTNSKKEISSKTKQSLQTLSEKGFKIGVCTGRHFATIGGLLTEYFPSDSLHVLAGGGLLTDTAGKIFYESNIANEVVREIAPIASKYDCRLVIQSGSEMYGNEKAQRFQSGYVLQSSSQKVMSNISTLQDWSVPLVIIGGVNEDVLMALQALPIQFKMMKGYSGEPYVDITNVGVTKASGVSELCKLIGVNSSEIIGFGDSENDVEFLQTVGYSIAMGNATNEVKSLADEVTDDCDHDGVATWIERNI